MNYASAAMRLLCGALFLSALCKGQEVGGSGSVIAIFNAALTPRGTLQGTLIVTAVGAPSLPFREAFLGTSGQRASAPPFGRFARDRQAHTLPLVIDSGDQQHPIKIQFNIKEDDFILPIQRVASLQLDLLTLVSTLVSQPDGNLRLGSRGTYREEISLEIPDDYALTASSHVTNENEFIRYESESKTSGGKLVIIRELQLKQETVSGSQKSEADSFSKLVSDDQKRTFVLRRTQHIDVAEWIQSVPADKAYQYGLQAGNQREHETARQLFERATNANPNDARAWDDLGRALAELGRWDEARQIYEKRISANPRDPYAYNGLGLLEEREGDWDRAVDSFRKQVELTLGSSAAATNLPRALLNAHRWMDAEEAARKAIQIVPNNVQQKIMLAVAQVCQHKPGVERHELDSALGATPTASRLNEIGYFLTECDRLDLAEPYIRRTLEALDAPGGAHENMSSAITFQIARGRYLDTYGWLLFKKGENDRALNVLEAAVSLGPDAEIYAHLAQAESKAGHAEKSESDWREAVLLQPAQVSHVPPEVAARLERLSPLSLDRVWYPLGADLPEAVVASLPAGQPSYFFLAANADGSVREVRELDAADAAAKQASPALRALKLPVISLDANPLSSVYIVKLSRDSIGHVIAARSVANEAVDLASDLLPSEFPLPDPAPPANPATTQSVGDAYRIGGGVSPPRIVYKVEPEYSEEARKMHFQGTVKLSVVVDAEGKPRDIKVIQPLGLGLDRKAIDAVSRWQFNPGRKDGQPVNVQAQIEVNFRLVKDQEAWRLVHEEFQLADGVQPPIVDKVSQPHVAKDGISATATLSFLVNEKGEPVNIRVDKSTDDDWSREVTDALKKWRLIPASKDGHPVAVACTMEFSRGD